MTLTRASLWIYTAAVAAFLVLPLIVIVPLSFSAGQYFVFPPPGLSLRWYEEFFSSEAWMRSLVQSLELALATMSIAVLAGSAAAFPLVRHDFAGRRLILLLVVSPLVVPQIVIALGLYILLLPMGLTDRLWTLALGESVLTIPFATLLIATGLRNLDRGLEDAAASLGASPLQVLRRVVLPGLRPSLVTAMAFTFIFSLNDLLIPLFIGSPNFVPLPVMVWTQFLQSQNLAPVVPSVLWLLCTLALLALIIAQQPGARAARNRVRAVRREGGSVRVEGTATV